MKLRKIFSLMFMFFMISSARRISREEKHNGRKSLHSTSTAEKAASVQSSTGNLHDQKRGIRLHMLMTVPEISVAVKNCRSEPCFPGTECTNTSTSPFFVCGDCPAGFLGNGIKCTDENECDFTTTCDPKVTCENLSPGYRCGPCPKGYTGSNGTEGIGSEYAGNNREECVDIDECADGNNGGCDPRVTCENLSPWYRCGPCPEGYTRSNATEGNGNQYANINTEECVDIDECADGNNGGCGANLTCVNTEGSYDCKCKLCYFGNVTVGCQRSPVCCPDGTMCHINAECHPSSGSYVCVCKTGFAGNGQMCGPDGDLDSFPDSDLDCSEIQCSMDNCVNLPNSGQEDADGDGIGDFCDSDVDNDAVPNSSDNCLTIPNAGQNDQDGDGVGDDCDNCPTAPNPGQDDHNGNGLGDECDPDMDDDGILNDADNCPTIKNNNQDDLDNDGLGDACDNCPRLSNTNQEDTDVDRVGDACDDDVDTDGDGIQDSVDNCPNDINSDQVDTDGDDVGDVCDNDMDDDTIDNDNDNCPLRKNTAQTDSDGDGKGDACEDDSDGDMVNDPEDNCKYNFEITAPDFRDFRPVKLHQYGLKSNWIIYNEGKQVVQTLDTLPEILVGPHLISGVDYQGTFYINTADDDDQVGFIFSYQSNKRFYIVMWKQVRQSGYGGFGEPGLQLKLIDSDTGPGIELVNSLWLKGDTPGQARLLWADPSNAGWKHFTSYRWSAIHRPLIGLIRVRVFEGSTMISDTGNVYDDTLTGGGLGLFHFSQKKIIWANLIYDCNDKIPQYAYQDLPPNLQNQTELDPNSVVPTP